MQKPSRSKQQPRSTCHSRTCSASMRWGDVCPPFLCRSRPTQMRPNCFDHGLYAILDVTCSLCIAQDAIIHERDRPVALARCRAVVNGSHNCVIQAATPGKVVVIIIQNCCRIATRCVGSGLVEQYTSASGT